MDNLRFFNQTIQPRLKKRTDPIGSGEASNSRGKMNDIATGVVHDTPMKQEAAAPQAEGSDGVAKSEPERHKHHPRPYIHPPQKRPRQQNHRYRRKHPLEPHHRRHRIIRRYHRRLQTPVLMVMRRRRQRRLL